MLLRCCCRAAAQPSPPRAVSCCCMAHGGCWKRRQGCAVTAVGKGERQTQCLRPRWRCRRSTWSTCSAPLKLPQNKKENERFAVTILNVGCTLFFFFLRRCFFFFGGRLRQKKKRMWSPRFRNSRKKSVKSNF